MKILGLILCLFLLAGCKQTALMNSPVENPVPSVQAVEPTATPDIPAGESIRLTANDGIQLDANFYPAEGDVGVILAHMGTTDQTSWQRFAADVADMGLPALTFDFRCFGKSECRHGLVDESCLRDVLTAIRYLRDKGYQRLVCVGGSMGATACLNASMQEELAGLGFIAGVRTAIPLYGKLYPEDMINPGMPKLFLTAVADPNSIVLPDTMRYYEDSPEPKHLITYAEAVHGTELFATPSSEKFRQDLIDFLLGIE